MPLANGDGDGDADADADVDCDDDSDAPPSLEEIDLATGSPVAEPVSESVVGGSISSSGRVGGGRIYLGQRRVGGWLRPITPPSPSQSPTSPSPSLCQLRNVAAGAPWQPEGNDSSAELSSTESNGAAAAELLRVIASESIVLSALQQKSRRCQEAFDPDHPKEFCCLCAEDAAAA